MSRFNEYYGGAAPSMKSTGALGAVKLKNQILKLDPTLVVALKNIRINGAPRGCSGFITDPRTGKHVYIHAEVGGYNSEAYYRTAEHVKDYRGGRNHFAGNDELATDAVQLLKAGR